MVAFAVHRSSFIRPDAMNNYTASLLLFRLCIFIIGSLVCTEPARAVPMMNDPKGFHNIAWGAALTTRQDMEAARSGPHVNEYRRKAELPSFAGTEMTSVLYVSVDDQFARVTIRYRGEQVHTQVLNFLQLWKEKSTPARSALSTANVKGDNKSTRHPRQTLSPWLASSAFLVAKSIHAFLSIKSPSAARKLVMSSPICWSLAAG